MKDSILLKISLVISILGILSLFFLSEMIKIGSADINQLEDYNEKSIKVKGTVEAVTVTESATFLKIKQPTIVNVVVFNPLNISKGRYVEVTGKVDGFNNKFEILADEIKVR